ncbi:MAG: outer membrane protein transport protein [Elusimicrobium sp.]|jgi:long-chain fatty acid transport protein|nr:outer membrane protein transport protein [Elusimicrobium sp.]
MKNTSKLFKMLFVLLPFILVNAAQGAGFALYEFSARGNAMGGSVMANDAEPASLAMNPALLTELDGTQLQLGATAVLPRATSTIMGSSKDLENKTFILPTIFLSHKMSDRFTLGFGAFSRFGLAGEYKDAATWLPAGQTYKVSLTSYSFVPTLAFKATDELSASAGLEVMYLDFSENLFFGGPNPEIKGTGWSLGGNFGLLYKPEWAEKWALGVSYKTKMSQDLNGSVTSNGNPMVPSGDARGKVTLPDSITAGVSYRPTKKLTLEGGITGTFWSSYDALTITYKKIPASLVDVKDYTDAARFNIGGEYKLDQNWAVRAGYVYDGSPINAKHMDTIVPVDNRNIFSLGAGYNTGVWGIDASYSYLAGSDLSGVMNTGLPIKYTNGTSHFIALSFKYAFNTK